MKAGFCFIIIILMTITPFLSLATLGDTDRSIDSRATQLIAKKGTKPLFDGSDEIDWLDANSVTVGFEDGSLNVRAKHDDKNLYFAIDCRACWKGKSPRYIFLEDDDKIADGKLDGLNDQVIYLGPDLSASSYVDGFWDKGWNLTGEDAKNRTGGGKGFDMESAVEMEFWIPLNSGNPHDISVKGVETLRFGVGLKGGWPNATFDINNSMTWGTLIVDYWPNLPPTAKIISPLPNDFVRGSIFVKATATDYDPKATISKVEVRISNGSWENAQLSFGVWSKNLDTTKLLDGPLSIAVRSNDSVLTSAWVQVNVTVLNGGPNHPPTLKKPFPNITFEQKSTLTNVLDLDDHFKDDDMSQTLTYSIIYQQNVKVVISSNNSISLEGKDGWFGTEGVILRASDGTDWIEAVLKVTVDKYRGAPIIDYSGTVLKVKAGNLLTYQVKATDPDNGYLTYYVAKNDTHGFYISRNIGKLEWTPNATQIGNHTLWVEVSDGKYSSFAGIKVEVLKPDPPKSFLEYMGSDKINKCPCTGNWIDKFSVYTESIIFGFYMGKYANLSVDLSLTYPIDIYLTDETNAMKYVNNQVFVPIPEGTAENSRTANYTFMAPEDGYYAIILDNSNVGKAPPISEVNFYTYKMSCAKKTVPPPVPPKPDDKPQMSGDTLLCIGIFCAIFIPMMALYFFFYFRPIKPKNVPPVSPPVGQYPQPPNQQYYQPYPSDPNAGYYHQPQMPNQYQRPPGQT